ncbi:hypothetical protein PAPYR_3914 [Paratrimastix pyriformis]|uniref:Uncharacterized protein n=1 Tax=Paratrimastix pyriformis TaxID=342808 RepID=A0ABQ8UN14_9EUKA|nr:hypothetical protein PAPYR_3914 [Paratrimastix pyriformis]
MRYETCAGTLEAGMPCRPNESQMTPRIITTSTITTSITTLWVPGHIDLGGSPLKIAKPVSVDCRHEFLT